MVAEHGLPRVAERIVDVLVPPIVEEIVKVVKTVLQEQISERIRKQRRRLRVTGRRAGYWFAQDLKPGPILAVYSGTEY